MSSQLPIALVTGAGTGLGRAIAITLAQNGFQVALTARREEKLKQVAKEIGHKETIVLPTDVLDEQGLKEFKDELLQKTHGKLDLLVNNVGGVPAMGPLDRMSLKQWNQVMDLNLTSAFLVTKTFLPTLRGSGRAGIICITSLAVHKYIKNMEAYTVSKTGVEALMRVVAEEEKSFGIATRTFDPINIASETNTQSTRDPMEVMDNFMDLVHTIYS